MDRSAERAAANEARFRAANEQIHDKVIELDLAERTSPYLCECEDERCTTIVLLTSKQYEAVRSSPRRFLLVAVLLLCSAAEASAETLRDCLASAGFSSAAAVRGAPDLFLARGNGPFRTRMYVH